jgi:hypothetical protein
LLPGHIHLGSQFFQDSGIGQNRGQFLVDKRGKIFLVYAFLDAEKYNAADSYFFIGRIDRVPAGISAQSRVQNGTFE